MSALVLSSSQLYNSHNNMTYGYIAYIDEAGDDGLRRVRPVDPNGASEWMVLSCVLIRARREGEVLPWVKDIITKINQHQITHLHYRQLRYDKKLIACQSIAELPVKLFSVLSNKQNMKGYINERASQSRNSITINDYGSVKPIRFEFSTRGGVRITNFVRYLKNLKDQDEIGILFNDYWKPSWHVIDFKQIHAHPAKERAGLQLADCVASAFYQGVELTKEEIVFPEPAITLEGRMCKNGRGRIYDFGVKVMPRHARSLVLPQQLSLLDFYSCR